MSPLVPQTASVVSAAFSLCTFTGCASNKIEGLDKPTFMPRVEVIQAVEDCEAAKMRPRVIYGYTKVQDRRIPVPLDVYCEPDMWRTRK